MPGKVLLFANNHWGLNDVTKFQETELGTELKPEMLSWPLSSSYMLSKHIPSEKVNLEIRIYRIILEALLRLDGFISVISIKKIGEHLEIGHPERVAIYFSERCVFESNTIYGTITLLIDDTNYEYEEAINWNVEEWHSFFVGQIESLFNDQLGIAKGRKEVVENDIKFAQSVLRHLGKLPEEKI